MYPFSFACAAIGTTMDGSAAMAAPSSAERRVIEDTREGRPLVFVGTVTSCEGVELHAGGDATGVGLRSADDADDATSKHAPIDIMTPTTASAQASALTFCELS